jgi:hypothetical protein
MGQGAVSTMRNFTLNLSFVHRQMLAEQARPDASFVCHEPRSK